MFPKNIWPTLSCLLVLVFVATAHAQCAWEEGFGGLPGPGGSVYSMVVFDDGTGPGLYVGGGFSVLGGGVANGIARWDGYHWSSLGSGLNEGSSVTSLAVFNDGSGPALYAGGHFTIAGGNEANRIAKWNGTQWSPLGSGLVGSEGLVGPVTALTVFDDGTGPALYAGGYFTIAGENAANRIAKWNGSAWSSLGTGVNGTVRTMQAFDDGTGPVLWVGGDFSTAGGISSSSIAKWDGAGWSAARQGMSGAGVRTLAVFDGVLYAGGDFIGSVAVWGGSSWVSWPALQLGQLRVDWLTVYDDGSGDALYATGPLMFHDTNVLKWDGTNWNEVGEINKGFNSLVSYDDGRGPVLYGGSSFDSSEGDSGFTRWDGQNWSPSELMNDDVLTFSRFNDGSGPAVYAGGSFGTVGAEMALRVARWDGLTWSALGPGLNNTVNDLIAFDDGGGEALYAAGRFTADGNGNGSLNHVAKWDGLAWSPLGGGLDFEALALTTFNDGSGTALYAGGYLSGGVAHWDGMTWTTVGSGLNGWVSALAEFDDGSGSALYAAGEFPSRIAKWNGAIWTPLGTGPNGTVYALTVFDNGSGPALYAGGVFGVARWDGANWTAVGGPFNDAVRTLTVFDDGRGPALFASGDFSLSVNGVGKNVARWDGASWSGFDYFNDTVHTLEAIDVGEGAVLYAGGSFQHHAARWSCPFAPDASGIDKSRFISFSPVESGESALRVLIVSSHHVSPPYSGGASTPFTAFEGQVRWVGPPVQYVESVSSQAPFYVSQLQCTPHYQDWSSIGLLNVTGSAIAPSSKYQIVSVRASCSGTEPVCTDVSAAFTAKTAPWGDVAYPQRPPETTVQPDLADISAVVDKFKSSPGSLTKTQVLLAGDDAFGNISPSTLGLDLGFGHIAACVDAFKGKPYPHTIQACP